MPEMSTFNGSREARARSLGTFPCVRFPQHSQPVGLETAVDLRNWPGKQHVSEVRMSLVDKGIERATHCGVCGALLPVDGRWWRRYCSKHCQDVSTSAARRERDPGYSARKAREWRANPPPRTEEQIAADRKRRARYVRRRRRRLAKKSDVARRAEWRRNAKMARRARQLAGC